MRVKRRLPRGVRRQYAEHAVREGMTRKTADELLHLWVSRAKRETHKRERREGQREIRESE